MYCTTSRCTGHNFPFGSPCRDVTTKSTGFLLVSAKIAIVIVNNIRVAGVWGYLSENGKNLVGLDGQGKPQSQGFIDKIHSQEACMALWRH